MAKRKSAIFVTQSRFGNVRGVLELQKKIAAMPAEVTERVKPALEKGADSLVDLIREIAPVSELEQHPGQLRDSARREEGRDELSVAVIVDGAAERGREAGKPIAAHVEDGHRTPEGGHVPAKPFFWPAFNVLKKPIRARVQRAATAGIKAAKEKGGKNIT